ncbi:MAG: AAA family ATPase [Gemmatimonadetes bacterium]|nr:AAA family ATPase [Gemmatimonadota bacterium]MYG84575.1 AAA family ATPase [Gemmatimonadota bacterium]MYJ90218.1 AAA family ATPase [Gemmatimonadota bacterium]
MNLAGELNPAQVKAASYVDGPLLVLAGAGSGKTRVLTYRIAYLVEHLGIDPYHILAVTFTNKAAAEMKERIDRMLGQGDVPQWVGTFHSLSARILRREAEILGFRRDFVIYDGEDQLALIRRMMKDLEISDKRYSPEAVRSYISGAKDQLLSPAEYKAQNTDYFEQQVVSRVYEAYQHALEDCNALDFDDLIMRLAIGYATHPDLLNRYQERFQYILVDEYQDTNRAQYEWINRLARKYRNLCVVGDDDQSIYAWRGADIRNILEFEKDYPEARVIRLEQNYRSTRLILKAGNEVIRNNKGRKGKELWTDNPGGEKIGLVETMDDRDEARWISRKIQEMRNDSNRVLRDFTLLYRTNAQSRTLEDELRRAGLPYVIVGGVRFFERKEVKDVLAYLKVLVNGRDAISFRRMVNTPARGIGAVSVSRVEQLAVERGMDYLEALYHAGEAGISGKAHRAAVELGEFLLRLRSRLAEISGAEAARRVLEKTGYLRALELEAAKNVESETRVQNVNELMAALEEATERPEEGQPVSGLDDFLEEVALVTDIDRWDESVDCVTLMTLHNAKGLEFPVVFITGMEDGLFPISRAMESPTDLEEERRLCYVGITRAREQLFLTHANLRRRFGGTQTSLRSRFIDEIPDDLVSRESTGRLYSRSSWPQEEKVSVPPFEDDITTPRTVETPMGRVRISQGQDVKHPIWGKGRIIQVAGSGDDLRATIRFSDTTKKVIVKYAALEMI